MENVSRTGSLQVGQAYVLEHCYAPIADLVRSGARESEAFIIYYVMEIIYYADSPRIYEFHYYDLLDGKTRIIDPLYTRVTHSDLVPFPQIPRGLSVYLMALHDRGLRHVRYY